MSLLSRLACIAITLSTTLLTGCVAVPHIEASKFAKPKTVVIADIPDINPVATIDIVVTKWPHPYYSGPFDPYSVRNGIAPALPVVADQSQNINQQILNQIATSPQPITPVQAGVAAGAGALVAAWIQSSGEGTQKRAAEFPSLVKKAIPETDLRADLLKKLQSALEAKQIQVRIDDSTRNQAPRLRWPAKDAEGKPLPVGPLAGSSPVDADLLVQIAPITLYASPGPLNSYSLKTGIAVALYNGRTREFLGWEAIDFDNSGTSSYSQYNSLVTELPTLAPLMRDALMSLVPRVAQLIAGEGGGK